MKKIRVPANLTFLAYEHIKQFILQGGLDEHTRLTEQYLSRQLGISKSPIREALTRLEAENLIRIEPRRGAYLRTLSTKDISELYDLREALETHVVRTARISPELIADLKQSVRGMRKFRRESNKFRYIEEDVRFHAGLANASGNELLCQALENVQDQIWIYRRNTYDLSSSSAPDFHEAILLALEKDDRTRAERAMREHIGKVRTTLLDFLEAQECGKAPSGSRISRARSAARERSHNLINDLHQ
jgi:DNA-binding GntR family transcriptional regulator